MNSWKMYSHPERFICYKVGSPFFGGPLLSPSNVTLIGGDGDAREYIT